MRYGIEIVNLGDFCDPRVIVRLAQAAERAGWEGLFLWDHLGFVWGAPSSDPWLSLAAVAAVTERLRLGTGVSPLPRYRPHLLAQSLATLDTLSGGRAVLGAGLGGVPEEYAAFGDASDAPTLAAMLDEGLALVDRLWAGEPVDHRGRFYTAVGVTLAPRPVQRPRIPVWVGGESRPALRRAAGWDGWIVGGASQDGTMGKTPEQIAALAAYIRAHRATDGPFDIAMSGYSAPSDGELVRAYAAAGVTWWLESLHGFRGSVDELLARVSAGPPH